jgi:hypothetical protein
MICQIIGQDWRLEAGCWLFLTSNQRCHFTTGRGERQSVFMW